MESASWIVIRNGTISSAAKIEATHILPPRATNTLIPVGIPHPAHSQSSEFFREHQDKPLSRRPRKRFGQACCPVWLFCRVRKVQKRAVDDFAGSYKIQCTAARIYLAMRWYASSKRIVCSLDASLQAGHRRGFGDGWRVAFAHGDALSLPGTG